MAYTLDGRVAPIGAAPEIREGRTYVPLRDLAEALGGTVTWDNDAKRATVVIGNWCAGVGMADTAVDVTNTGNGSVTPVNLNAAPYVDGDGNMWVPASFFQTAFGYQVSVSGEDVSIVNPAA
jgi:hypothetical protein